MQQLTIKEAREARDHPPAPGEVGQYIYRYLDGETTFYVGRSVHPVTRLREHLGEEGRLLLPDAIGWLILDNQPASLSWIMEVSTLEELAPDLDLSCTSLLSMYAASLEEDAIARFRPCLNVLSNSAAAPLPAKYRRRKFAPLKLPE